MKTPVIPVAGVLSPLGLGEVSLTGGFWAARPDGVLIEHCLEWIDRTGWLRNFADAGGRGRVFADSEIYKVLEAMAWSGHPRFGEVAEAVAAAQDDDGYLHTKFGGPGQPGRYSDLEWGHELYCYGHLIQAAVAQLRSGVEGCLAKAAVAAADHVCREFGARDDYCGHPEIEMALVELFRATGEQRYLDQAKRFVDQRGAQRLGEIEFGRAYFQDDMTVRSRQAFSGHAVRELYLACGAVDVAVETGDAALLAAIIGQWERTVARRTYLTGGMGSRHEGESFGDDWELPPDGAYAETCAGIASVMLSWRLLLATGEARFADLMERTLYNIVATSPAPDGRSFFYANPLQQRVLSGAVGMSSRAVTGQRAPWFDVSCCPTNLARTFASLPAYLATSSEQGLQIHHYAPSVIQASGTELQVTTDYPWHGDVVVRVVSTPSAPWTLSLRIPPWAAEGSTVDLRPAGGAAGQSAVDLRPAGGWLAEDGARDGTWPARGGARDRAQDWAQDGGDGAWRAGDGVTAGYVTLRRQWRAGDELRLRLPVEPRWTYPDPRVDAARGCAAVEAGPLVYCAETPGGDAGPATLDPSVPLVSSGTAIIAAGSETVAEDNPWPYGDIAAGEPQSVAVSLVPYHLWATRGPSTMRVWLPLTSRHSA